MNAQHFNVIIIGSGPAGEGAAMKLAKSGQSVAVVEAFERVGLEFVIRRPSEVGRPRDNSLANGNIQVSVCGPEVLRDPGVLRFSRSAQVIDTRRSASVGSFSSSGTLVFLPLPRFGDSTSTRRLLLGANTP